MDHELLPQQAQRSGTGQSTLLQGVQADTTASYPLAEDHYRVAADTQSVYTAGDDLSVEIDRAREAMERAAKSLDFLAAAGCGTGCTNCRNSSRKKRRANRPICSGKNPTDNLRARDRATHAKKAGLEPALFIGGKPGHGPDLPVARHAPALQPSHLFL